VNSRSVKPASLAHPFTFLRRALFSDLSDVFLIVYLLKQPFTDDGTMTRKTESFAAAYARELKRGAVPSEDEVAE
jgi:hypothetical protein